MNGSSTAAIKAMIASTQTISIRVKPLCADSLIFCIFLQALERNIRGEPAAAFQIRSVPGGDTRRLPHQCGQSFRARGKATGIEEVQIERARKALQLDF